MIYREGMESFLKSLPVLLSVTLILTSWTRRHLLSFPRGEPYSGSLPKRPYSSCLRSILSEGSPYMSSPIHSSLLPSFVPFSSIVTSWSSQTPSKYTCHFDLLKVELKPASIACLILHGFSWRHLLVLLKKNMICIKRGIIDCYFQLCFFLFTCIKDLYHFFNDGIGIDSWWILK